MTNAALFQAPLRLGGNTLILSHRISQWCGHAPVLEEDIALANTALDLIGQTQMWLGLAGEVEGAGQSADDLAYLRDVDQFRNILMVERPNGDFGHTMMRQFLFDAFNVVQLDHLVSSSNDAVAEIAQKAIKEAAYHLQRSRDTVIGLGDGSDESHARMQTALSALWPYTGEMFLPNGRGEDQSLQGVVPDPVALRPHWDAIVGPALKDATLHIPNGEYNHQGGKTGAMHTEHLGHILTQLQWLQRTYPGATW